MVRNLPEYIPNQMKFSTKNNEAVWLLHKHKGTTKIHSNGEIFLNGYK